MNGLRISPEAKTYEKGLGFWPYKTSLDMVIKFVTENASQNANVIDMMCGPGYLLAKLQQARPDLKLFGVDIDEEYMEHGRSSYPGIAFQYGDVRTWEPSGPLDIVLCTGALHHIPYCQQADVIANIARMVKPDGVVVISDCYVDNYENEEQRMVAAAKLGYEYLKHTIEAGAPREVVVSTADILVNDVLKIEYKTSLAKRLPLLQRHFQVRTARTWPRFYSYWNYSYGDYIHFCSPLPAT